LVKRGDSPKVVGLDLSLGEVICQVLPLDIQGTHALQVSTLNDIVAEKLRSLLQQPIRKRNRPQDLLDIAAILRENPTVNRSEIRDFFILKAKGKQVSFSRRAFDNPEIKRMAQVDYDALASTARLFIPFEEAFSRLLAFVNELALPEQ
jgi:predicted nucleotidyltransferase component of viral defense system